LKKILGLFRQLHDPRLLPIGKAEEILAREGLQDKIEAIRHLAGISDAFFESLYLSAIEKAADTVQLCPGSESHHHAWPGGLISHILESCAYALEFRKGVILPVGSSPEVAARKADLYSYAVFAGTLLHDIAKPLSDQKIALHTRNGRYLCDWDPLSEDIREIPRAASMRIEFRADRVYSHHLQEGLTFLQRILPDEGRRWLQSDKEVYSEFLSAFSSDPVGPIHELMSRGDRVSVSKALGAQQIPRFEASSKPLWMKLRTALRHLVEKGDLSLNRRGAAGWVDKQGVWLMSKRAVDAVREQLLKEGHSGVPGDNNRIYDILSESGLLVPNGNGKAIWRGRVVSNDWAPETPFSLIRLKHDCIWSNPDTVPLFDGRIEIADDEPMPGGEGVSEREEESVTASVAAAPAPVRVPEPGEPLSPVPAIPVPEPLAAVPVPGPEAAVRLDGRAAAAGDGVTAEGEKFRRWVEHGVNRRDLTVNTRESIVHFIEEGVFLVSPEAWRKYALDQRTGWENAQKSFQALKINLKTPQRDENVWRVRVEFRGRVSQLKGWIVPYSHFSLDGIPKTNPVLTLIQPDADPARSGNA